jgi:hypothetical protein
MNAKMLIELAMALKGRYCALNDFLADVRANDRFAGVATLVLW